MVLHRGNNLLQRDIYPPREQPTWPGDRNFGRTYNNENLNPARFNPETSIHGRSVPIGTALGECAGLDQKEFALIVQQSNGEFKTYTSPALRDLQDRIFSTRFQQNFQSIVRQASCIEVYGLDSGGGFNDYDGEANGVDHRKQSSAGTSDGSSSGSRKRRKAQNAKGSDDEGSGSSSRKRRWGRYAPVDHEDDTPQPMQSVKNQMLRIGDDEEVHNLYHTRFKDMQQAACKVMGKAFVKLIEPKKQTHHPYTKGDEKRPPWWPPTTGDNHVRHKEPDHLLKPERIRLLTHILEMVIEPYHKQHPTVQKLGLNVSKLQDVTMEAMNNWFNDKEHTANAAKKPFLKEIFRVAKVQERYKNGEIDDTTKVSVMSADCTGGSSSDDEPDDGDAYDEAENTSPLIPSPDSIVSASGASMMQNIQPGPRPMDDSRAREIDLVNRQRHDWRPTQRYHTQSQMDDQNSSFQNDSFRQQKWELNGTGPSFHQPPPDPSHHSQFQAPQQQSMYGWQNTSMPIIGGSTNGPSPQPFYGTSPQSSNGPGSYQLPPLPTNNPLPPQSMPPPLALNHSGYNDGLPAGGTRYDTGPATLGTQMRTGSLGHPYGPRDHQGSGGYSDFLNEHGAFNHAEDSIKDDQHHLHPQ